jgi:7,8-dihydropterin-6-yl-methyl-4-(beta-D-ribofuranosyl)aminobenzene 5'-phosphate synthase
VRDIDRRTFLQASAALGTTVLAGQTVHPAHAAARLDAPVVDRIVIHEVTDGYHDLFLRGSESPGLAVQRTGMPAAPQGKTLKSEWGLALHIESQKGDEKRRYLLDFGFTPDVYANNLDLLKIDVAAVDALILSHGHFDHYGGLQGFLEAQGDRLRKGLRLYTGGEDNFCHRMSRNSDGTFVDFGTNHGILDRRKLRALGIEPILSEDPVIIEGHAFTTGAVPRTSLTSTGMNTRPVFVSAIVG